MAHRATLMYFLIAEFATCDVMYQTSLGQFNQQPSSPSTTPTRRRCGETHREHHRDMTYSIYLYIQRGLFEQLTFALMLTNKIQVSAKALSLDLVNLFLKGGARTSSP